METNNNVVERPMLGFGEAVKICLKKYFTFTGRARRSEYWWFALFGVMLSIVTSFLDGILFAALGTPPSIFNGLASLFMIIPCMAVTFRRLHDTGRSGWWYGIPCILAGIAMIVLVATSDVSGMALADEETLFKAFSNSHPAVYITIIVSLILSLVCFVFTLLNSHKEANKYGPSPKYQ